MTDQKPQPDDEQLRALLNVARLNQALTHLAIGFAGAALLASDSASGIKVAGVFLALYGVAHGVAPLSAGVRRVLSILPGDVPQRIDRESLESAADGSVWADGGDSQ